MPQRFEFFCPEHGVIATDVRDPILQQKDVPVSCPDCGSPLRFRLRDSSQQSEAGDGSA